MGVEFSRVPNLRNLAHEAYKINTFLFPASWQAFANYGDFLSRTKETEAATMACRKALSLNPTNDVVRGKLDKLSKN